MENQFYRKKKSRWDLREPLRRLFRNTRVLFVLAILLPLAGYVVFGSRGIVSRIRLERQKAELEQRLRDAEEEARQLKEKSKALEGDRATIERVARENHGMVRQGETVYKAAPNR